MDEQAMNRNHHDDEIDLTRVFPILWKRKWVLIATILVTVSLGVVLAFSLPDIYRVYVVLQPGILDVTPDGKYIYLDSVQNIKAKIDSNTYYQRLYEANKEGLQVVKNTFNVDIPRNSNVLSISTEIGKEHIKDSIHNIYILIHELQKDYSAEIERRKLDIAKLKRIKENEILEIQLKKRELDNQIAQVKNNIEGLKNQIDSYQHTLTLLEAREKELTSEIMIAQRNSERLIHGRESFIQQHSDPSPPDLADILYTTTIQQNVSFSNELQNRLSELKMKMEEIKGLKINAEKSIEEKKIYIEQLKLQKNEQLDAQIAHKNIEIQDLEERSSYIQNIQMLNKPLATAKPVKPNRKIFIVLSTIFGCFLGLGISLLTEYLMVR